MKKLILLMFFIPMIGWGQDCKIKEKKDDFTGTVRKSIEAKFVRETMKTNIDVEFVKLDTVLYLAVEYNPQYYTAIISVIGDKLTFLMLDGSKLELENVINSDGQMMANKTTKIRTMYKLSPEDVSGLTAQPISKIRIVHNTKFGDHEIKPKFYDFFKSALACIK